MKIDPTGFPTDHPVSCALRRVSRYWFLAYSKLLSLDWEWDTSFPYGATDGKVLILNPDGIEKLARLKNGTDYIAFLLVHEAMHALLGHGWRLASMADKTSANVAADYVINAMIAARNRELGKEVFPMIPGVLLDEKLSGNKSTEQLYRELRQPKPDGQQYKPDNDNQDSNEEQDNQDSGEEDPGESGGQEQGEDDTDAGAERDTEGGDSGDNADSSSNGEVGGVDTDSGESPGEGGEPADGDADEDSSGSGQGSSGEFSPEGFPGTGASDTRAPSPEEGEDLKDLIDRIEEDNDRLLTMDAIDKQTASDRGQTGQRIAAQRDIGYQMPWYDLLRELLMRYARVGWDSPFNHSIHSATGLVAAGRRSRAAGSIVWVIDTSGSVGAATFARFLGEVQVALDSLKPEEMHLLSVSHQVCESILLEAGDIVPSSMKGGGGTLFRPAFSWVEESDIIPDVLVYLTDGLASDIASLDPPDYPVVWLSTRSPDNHYPFGEVIQVRDL